MNLSDTVSLLELFVFIVSVAGISLSALLVAVYIADRSHIKAGGGDRIDMRMVNGNLRNELKRIYIQLGYMTLAVYAMTVPPPIRPANARFGDVLIYLLISFELVMISASLWDFVDRRRNQADLARMGDHHDHGDYIDWPPSGPINKGD
jgi:hypothetical protein